MTTTTPDKSVRSFLDIKGWFNWLDRAVFDAVLDAQEDQPPGHLVELGTYLGRSTVIVGDHWREDRERFVVVDLFGRTEILGESAEDAANRREAETSYKTLTRRQFESNYLALHDRLPEIVEGYSSEIVDHVDEGTARFVHVDASHLYPQVKTDVQSAKRLLRPGGIVVFDDFRSEHTPGVAAAVWEAVFFSGLIPVAVTPMKLYGVFDDPHPYLAAIKQMVESDPQYWVEEQEILGRPVLRLALLKQPAPATTAAPAASTTPAPPTPARLQAAPLPGWRRVRRTIAKELVPPALTTWWLGRRRGT